MQETLRRHLGGLALFLLLLAVAFGAVAAGAVAATLPVPAPQAAAQAPSQEDQVKTLLDAFPAGMTESQLDAVLAVMDKGELQTALRARLLVEMAQRHAAARADPNILQFYRQRLDALARAWSNLPASIADAFLHPAGTDRPLSPWRLALSVAGLILLGCLAMAAARHALAPWRARLAPVPGAARGQLVANVVFRVMLELVEIAVFPLAIVVGYLVMAPSHPVAAHVLLVTLRAIVTILLVVTLSRLMCSPRERRLRLLPLEDRAAAGLHRAVVVTVVLLTSVAAATQLLAGLGLPRAALQALGLPLSALPYAWLIFLVWRHQRTVLPRLATTLRLQPEARPLMALLPVIASLYLVGLWVMLGDAALRGEQALAWRAFASIGLLMAIPGVAILGQRLLYQLYRPQQTDESAGPVPPARHLDRLVGALWVVVTIGAAVATAWLWGLDLERIGLGGAVLGFAIDLGTVVLLGYVAWALIDRLVERMLEKARSDPRSSRTQRLATLLPLLRSFLQSVLVAMLAMILLSSIGIEIGPLLAGAGVVGIAIGLGAQSSIADILAGVFFLLEDAFNVGDYVEVGNIRGTVESISLRSLKLRHHRGAVHTLPFGRIPSLTNYSRDWALMRLEFRVKPDTDVARLKKLVKGVAQELAADPEMGPNFIEPLKSQGVRRVEDNAIIIGIKYIARPGEQFVIRREAYQRLLKTFQENGIELVGRGVVVKVEGSEPSSTVAGAAAGEVVRQAAEG